MLSILLQFGVPGTQEMIIILLIAVLLFGANKIPKLARSTGQALGEFQKGREEIEQELEDIKEGPSVDSGSSGPASNRGGESASPRSARDASTESEPASDNSA